MHQVGLYTLVAAVVLFAALNLQKVRVDIVFTSITMSLVFVIAATAIVGLGAGYLYARNRRIR
jgi:ABC-type glucose/galactose transport system permease subunit